MHGPFTCIVKSETEGKVLLFNRSKLKDDCSKSKSIRNGYHNVSKIQVRMKTGFEYFYIRIGKSQLFFFGINERAIHYSGRQSHSDQHTFAKKQCLPTKFYVITKFCPHKNLGRFLQSVITNWSWYHFNK